MRGADYLVETLIRYGVTDVFGIPGGVVLEFLYALEARRPEITPRLSFHEQAAGFAACGYAQAGGAPGAAYAARGPGFTNLLTAVAEAYQESLPVVFVTAHAWRPAGLPVRMEADQELDAAALAAGITKYAARIDEARDFRSAVDTACRLASGGRKGPVLLDVYSPLWDQEVGPAAESEEPAAPAAADACRRELDRLLAAAERPVILAGDGVRQSGTEAALRCFAERRRIPVLTSRGAQDLMPDSPLYFGYIGSHGLRCGNFVLSKADLIVSMGNRMSFPPKSRSFAPLFERTRTVRLEADGGELRREIPNSVGYQVDLRDFFRCAESEPAAEPGRETWLSVCRRLRDALYDCDTGYPVSALAELFRALPEEYTIVSDVGNHEFWVSRAYARSGSRHRLLCSRSFGTLGCALPKSIGACLRTGRPVLCIVGDQGLQMNIQELQSIAAARLPVVILLLNNRSSGMIRSRQRRREGARLLHTTERDGYSVPDFGGLARAYGLAYCRAGGGEIPFSAAAGPVLAEMEIDPCIELEGTLPAGNACQDMAPALSRALYEELDAL